MEQQKLITQSKRDFVIKLAKDSNLQFVHVRAKDDHEPKQILSKGGVTVVYQRSNLKNGRIVKVSCALVNDIDVYNKNCSNIILLLKKNNIYYPIYVIKNNNTIGLFNNSDDIIQKLLIYTRTI